MAMTPHATTDIAPDDQDRFVHEPAAEVPGGWFDRFYFNVHSPEARISLAQGMAIYPQERVVDGYCVIAEEGVQHNLRVARNGSGQPDEITAGPLRAQILHPGRRWRFCMDENDTGVSYDLQFDADLTAIDIGRIRQVSRRTGALADVNHFAQPGRVTGKLHVRGQSYRLDEVPWFGVRDRTWGVRPGPGMPPPSEAPPVRPDFNPHDWVFGRLGEHCFFYLMAQNRSGPPQLLGGALVGPRGRREIGQVERTLQWDGDGRFGGAEATLHLGPDEHLDVKCRPSGLSLYMRGGLYGGWEGQRHGSHRGPLKVTVDRWVTADTSVLGVVGGLTDHVVGFESDLGAGMGIYEVTAGI